MKSTCQAQIFGSPVLASTYVVHQVLDNPQNTGFGFGLLVLYINLLIVFWLSFKQANAVYFHRSVLKMGQYIYNHLYQWVWYSDEPIDQQTLHWGTISPTAGLVIKCLSSQFNDNLIIL